MHLDELKSFIDNAKIHDGGGVKKEEKYTDSYEVLDARSTSNEICST